MRLRVQSGRRLTLTRATGRGSHRRGQGTNTTLAKGTKFELAVKKVGYVLWVAHAEANYGKFTMNANLTPEVFR